MYSTHSSHKMHLLGAKDKNYSHELNILHGDSCSLVTVTKVKHAIIKAAGNVLVLVEEHFPLFYPYDLLLCETQLSCTLPPNF